MQLTRPNHVFLVVVAAIVLSEHITGVSSIGGAIILAGVWLVNRE